MADQQHVEILRRGADEWNAWRAAQPAGAAPDLRDADLRWADLRDVVLRSANLAGARLYRACLDGADLTGANLRNAWMSKARLHGADLSRADLGEARLDHAAARAATFTEAGLRDADVRRASLRESDLTGIDAAGARFEYAVLAGVSLRAARLSGADLAYADLSGADLAGADLHRARLRSACLLGAMCTDADLAGALDADTSIRRPDDPEPFERAAPSVVTTEPKPGHISAMFSCQRPGCPDSAGWVAVIARGVSHPDDAVLLRSVLEPEGMAGQILLGGFLDPNSSSPLTHDRFARVSAGLIDGDVLTVWEVSDDYTPFYCVCCRAVFCARHFQLEEHWDPDWGITPDYWTGTCPNGHRIFIDH